MDSPAPSDALRPPSGRQQRPISPSRRSHQRSRSAAGEAVHSLLSDISPSLILKLLHTAPPVSQLSVYNATDPASHSEEFLRSTISRIAASDRIWLIKAATFARRIQEWEEELNMWEWLNTEKTGGNGFQSSSSDPQIAQYETRVVAIQAALKTLEVDELKCYVRDAHAHEYSYGGPGSSDGYEMMDDLTALITATIVQALPRLARLNSLLDRWSTRFLVLRRVPGFSKELSACKQSMFSAYTAAEPPKVQSTRISSFTRKVFTEMRAILHDQVSQLARHIDNMLDLLENSQDTLPDRWIDDVDQLENDYSSWLVKAEQVVLNHELDLQHSRTRLDFTRETNTDQVSAIGALSTLPTSGDPLPNAEGQSSAISPPFNVHSGHQEGPTKETEAVDAHHAEQVKEIDQNDNHASTDEGSGDSGFEGTKEQSGSATSESSSAASSPQLARAEIAIFQGSPALVSTPVSIRQSMGFPSIAAKARESPALYDPVQRRSWHGLPTVGTLQGHQRKRSSSLIPSLPASPTEISPQTNPSTPRFTAAHTRPRSASIKSFEVVTPENIRRIQVTRKESHSSPKPPSANGALPTGADSLGPRASLDPCPGPKVLLSQPPKRALAAKTGTPGTALFQDPQPVSDAKGQDDSSAIDTEIELPKSHRSPSTERLEKQITSILNSIPANIRLTSASDASITRTQTSIDAPRAPTYRRVSMPRILRSKTSGLSPAAVLAPAPKIGPSDAHVKDSGIKLYHLHRSDRGAPIKLYIRLVGEAGDRVMVRVGGGWADLGEYLKEYASHHGKRSISDGKFNMQGIASPNSSSPASSFVRTPASRPISPISSSKEQSEKRVKQGNYNAGYSSPPTTSPDSFASELDSPSSSLGLAGPKTRKVDISPRKQAWVEGMLRQARRASGADTGREIESREGSKFGDLGKVGGVKRVFMRSRKDTS